MGLQGAVAPPPPQRLKGLAYDKRHDSWRVRISLGGKQYHLGR